MLSIYSRIFLFIATQRAPHIRQKIGKSPKLPVLKNSSTRRVRCQPIAKNTFRRQDYSAMFRSILPVLCFRLHLIQATLQPSSFWAFQPLHFWKKVCLSTMTYSALSRGGVCWTNTWIFLFERHYHANWNMTFTFVSGHNQYVRVIYTTHTFYILYRSLQ